MSEPLISVVIPAYNAEKRLDRCLKSVCGQDWEALQILVIDDGSRDGTVEKAKAWARQDARVEIIHQSNMGVARARNNGLDHCRGEWIRFVDADDELPPGSLRIQMNRVTQNSSDLLLSGYEHHVGDVVRVCNLASRDETISCDEYLLYHKRYGHSFFCGVLWNKLFRRELIERGGIRFRDGLTFGEDFTFVCEYLAQAERITFSTDVVFRYIRHPGSLTFSQAMDSVVHPIRNAKVKFSLYRSLKTLFQERGMYERYGRGLWLYLFRFTLNQ